MNERLWKLRCRNNGKELLPAAELTFNSEGEFLVGLQVAYQSRAADLVATLPDGRVLTEAVLRKRFPPR